MDKYRIAFYGTPDFAVPVLESLIQAPSIEVVVVVTQPDRPAGRGKSLAAPPVKMLAETHSIPVLQPERIKDDVDKFIEELENLGPIDLAVVVAFGQILPLSVLEVPKAQSVNIHASLLPRWRGAAPIHHAILQGDTHTGVCLMKMEKGLDTGPVFVRSEVPITASDNLQSLHDSLAALGARLLIDTIPKIISGELVPTPQGSEGITYAHKINADDARIDWSRPAEQIERMLRAFDPFPGAFCYLNSKRLKLFQGRVTSYRPGTVPSAPGTILYKDRDSLEIQCAGESVLSLTQVQLSGKRRMLIREFLQGTSIEIGDILVALEKTG